MANETTQVAAPTQEKRQLVTDYSKGIFGTSDNFLMASQMAKALADSTIVPREFQKNWSNCLIAIEQAQRLGMSPMMIMQNMYVVYGRPSWSSKFLIAMINNSGKYDQPLRFREEQKGGKPFACTAWTTKGGEIIEGMTIDMDIAKAEGWIDKNGSKWKTMPQLMLRYRAASFFSSLNCPEITMGLNTDDELRDGTFSEDLTAVTVEANEIVGANTATQVIDIPEPENAGIPEITQAGKEFETMDQIAEAEKVESTKPEPLKVEPAPDNDGQMFIPGF